MAKLHKVAKAAGYRSNKEFYKHNPTEADFASNHPEVAKKFGIGGSVGSVVGGIAGSLIAPGIGTGIGASLGSTVGNLIDQQSKNNNNNRLLKTPPIPAMVNPNPYGNMGDGGKIVKKVKAVVDNILTPKNSKKDIENFSENFLYDRTHNGENFAHGQNSQYAQGGMTDPVMQQQMSTIDVEKGELRVGQDQSGRSVIKEEYKNPNKFEPHAENPMKEPMGNFVEAPAGDIIISKDMVNLYKQGDDITRKSIERKLVQRQAIEKPEQLGIQRSKKGGMVVRKYGGGGGTMPGMFTDDFGTGMDFLSDPANLGNLGNTPDGQTSQINNDPFRIGSTIETPTSNKMSPIGSGPTDSLSPNWERIAPIAADAFQFANAINYDQPNRIRNKGNAIARQNLNQLETKVNVEPQLQQINRSSAAQLSSIRNQNVGSTVQNAQGNQVQANNLAQLNNIMGEKTNREQDLRNSKRSAIASFESQAGSEDAGFQNNYDVRKQESKDNATNIRNASITDAATKVSQFGSEDKYFNIIKDSLKDYFDFSAFDKSNFSGAFKENPELIKHVIDSVQFNGLDDATQASIIKAILGK